jgi:hypothetical protein
VASFGVDPAELEEPDDRQGFAHRLRETLQRAADGLLNRHGVPQHLVSQTHGVLSLSDRPDSLLMWAHYASNHRGFAVEFRASHEWLAQARSVAYGSRRPFVAPLAPTKSQAESAGPSFFFAKSSDWAYEREWRLVRKLGEADTVLTIKGAPPQLPLHLFNVPRSAVTGVIIGARMPHKNRERLAEIVLSWPRRRLRTLRAHLSPRKFELEFDPISRKDLRAMSRDDGPRRATPATPPRSARR